MMRSLFSGVTGLRSHQTRMDVIGNNIANVNTVGFKKSAVTFKDLYSETISAAAGPSGDGASGGVNPRQIGLGVTVNSIAVVHTPGAAQYTGNSMDVAISGDGFFVVETPTGKMYTRGGNFYTDTAGNLVTAMGHYVQVVDPVVDTGVMTSVDKVNVDDLFVAGGGKFDYPASNVHSGKITADLSGVAGVDYGFRFVPDGTGLFSSITRNYQPTFNANAVTEPYETTTKMGVDKDGKAQVINMKAIADAYLTAVGATGTPGSKKVEIMEDPDNLGSPALFVDGMKIGTAVVTDDGGNAPDPTEVKIDFVAVPEAGGNPLGSIYITDSAGEPIPDTLQLDMLYNLIDIPDIPIEEGGQWELFNKNSGETIEPVVLDYKATAGGAGVAAGDILFTTSNYGSFRLRLKESVDGMAALSTALADSSFSVSTLEETYVEYSSPSGELLEGSLKNLNIDFSRYSNLAIDSKGAVIAQLKNAETLVINGVSVDMAVGDKVVLGYIALANFNNPTGLEKRGDNLYEISNNSGLPSFQMPGSGSVGELAPANLEMSNVDLSEEMVNMIITQRGFQANSRIITTSDTMLEELINLKR